MVLVGVEVGVVVGVPGVEAGVVVAVPGIH